MRGRFRVLRDRRNTLETRQCKRVVFSWQAQHFVMWPFAMSWQAQHFVTWRRCFFDKLQCQGRANLTLLQISWQAQHSVSVLESGGSFAKVILFELCKNGVIRKTRTKSSIFKLKVWNLKEVSHEMLVFGASNFQGERSLSHFAWQDFGSFLLEKLKMPRTKCSF